MDIRRSNMRPNQNLSVQALNLEPQEEKDREILSASKEAIVSADRAGDSENFEELNPAAEGEEYVSRAEAGDFVGQDPDGGQYFLKWQSVDFVRTAGVDYFYRAAIILAVIVILWSLWQGNYFSALPFALMITVVIFVLNSQPRAVNYEVNMNGVMMDDKLLPFSEIQSFDIISKGDLDVVRLKMRNAIFPLKEIFLSEGMDLVYVKTLFEHFLPEERQEERLFNFETRRETSDEDELDRAIDKYIQRKF